MKWTREAFGWLQKIGKSLMLPVSVLPAAGILLGVGSAKFSWRCRTSWRRRAEPSSETCP
jgi:phosphotransferase system  glucose/maltose/N-acetylglucosamine-specific IIC component